MNQWRRISADYWMCFLFDVWFEHGVWYASFYLGRRFAPYFKSARAAMAYCNRQREDHR